MVISIFVWVMAKNTNKRIPVKWVRDGAKSAYEKQSVCYICGTDQDLELHHTHSITLLLERWSVDKGYDISTDDGILAVRDEFIEDHHKEIYEDVYTLCNPHHVKLHGVYGKAPGLHTAPLQARWIEKQKSKGVGEVLDKKPFNNTFSEFYWGVKMNLNPLSWFKKDNPAQYVIAREEGLTITTDQLVSYYNAFDKLESVNRGVNMIVNACSSLDYDVKDKKIDGVVNGVRQKTLFNLLNYNPNPYQSAREFRTNIFTDFLLEGNVFIYWDGAYFYHLPASRVVIETDPKTFVRGYNYNSETFFKSSEIIHFKDLSSTSIYRGTSRLVSANRNIRILYKMQTFQEQFFDNGAVMGLILTSDNTLSQQAKERTIQNWITKWSPKNGARKPMILDSGLKPANITQESFKEMDFDVSIKTHDEKILKALGVPPILLAGGNNANISPNLRLFYLETVMPIVQLYVSSIERFFGYDVEGITSTVSALQPELKDLAAYYTTLVNGGVLTPNEARVELRYETKTGHDDLRIPANIAGSASNPSVGGRPEGQSN